MENDEKKIRLFEEIPIGRAVLTLSVPTTIASLVMVIYNLADTYFVGYLNDPVQNAAVTLAAPVLLAFNAINNLFGVGAGTAMSRAMGRRDYEGVKRFCAFGVYCALAASLLFALLVGTLSGPLLQLLGATAETEAATYQYLFWTAMCGACPAILNVVLAYMVRSEGSTLHASIGTMSGCILNIILDPFFILPMGLGLGAAGAGLATFISNCVACLYFLILVAIRRGKTFVCLNPRYAIPNRTIAGEVFSVGIPASIQNLLNVTGMTIMNNLASGYGTAQVAAIGISYKINMIPMYIAMGVSQGVMPLIGYTYAAKKWKRMKETLFFTMKLAIGFMSLMLVLYLVGAPILIGLFIENQEIVSYGTVLLRLMCIGAPFLSFDFLCVGVYQACGKGLISLIFALCRKIVLEIPALLLLDWLFPFYGLGFAQALTEIFMALGAVFVLRHLFKTMQKEEAA